MDCGVAPGMGNIIFGHHDKSMKITDYECLVGGLPEKREWPYEYQAVFSPIDVIEEYIRPARYVQHSQLITKEALSDTELIEFDEIGTLESWNSDGLRTLIKTMSHVPNMIEKTLRYPGCVEYLKVHPAIHQKGMTFLIRQLAPGEKGLPIEIYVFVNDIRWVQYEAIQSDIFDHIFAVLPKFGLRALQDGTVEAAAARGLPIIESEI